MTFIQIAIQIAILLIGFLLLVKGADFFVDGSSGIARIFQIPSIVIGLTIVSFGTSLPELAVSLTSALKGINGIAIGNVVGSNIVNLMLVAGATALISPIPVGKSLLNKDFPFSILITGALLTLIADTFLSGSTNLTLSRGDGIILLVLFSIFMYSTVSYSLANRQEESNEESEKTPLWKSIVLSVTGLAGVIAGGQMVVKSASSIAAAAGMSDTLIGLTVVAFGTSLPELVTSLIAAKKGENDIAIGNVVGSNIFNILFILGLSATISPMANVDPNIIADSLILIAFSTVVWICAKPKLQLGRTTGLFMLILFAAYNVYIFMR